MWWCDYRDWRGLYRGHGQQGQRDGDDQLHVEVQVMLS